MTERVLKLGTRVENFIKLKAIISANEKAHKEKQDALKEKASALEIDIIKELKKNKLERADGKTGAVTHKKMIHANVKDWDKFYKYIKKHDAFFLMQKRASDAAYREMIEAGEEVPGVTGFIKETLGVVKKRG